MSRSPKSMVNTEELGRAIRRRRVELSFSLRDVADATGVSASTLSRIENGTGKPDADNETGGMPQGLQRSQGRGRRRNLGQQP